MMPPPGPAQLASTSEVKCRYQARRRHLVPRAILVHATLDTILMMSPRGLVQLARLLKMQSPTLSTHARLPPTLTSLVALLGTGRIRLAQQTFAQQYSV